MFWRHITLIFLGTFMLAPCAYASSPKDADAHKFIPAHLRQLVETSADKIKKEKALNKKISQVRRLNEELIGLIQDIENKKSTEDKNSRSAFYSSYYHFVLLPVLEMTSRKVNKDSCAETKHTIQYADHGHDESAKDKPLNETNDALLLLEALCS